MLDRAKACFLGIFSEEGSASVDSLLGIAAACAAAAVFGTFIPTDTPANYANGSKAQAELLAVRAEAQTQHVALATFTPSGTGIQATFYLGPPHTGATDSITGLSIGLVKTLDFNEAMTVTADGQPLTPPFTIHFASDGTALVNGAVCTTLSFTFTAQAVPDSFSLSCHR